MIKSNHSTFIVLPIDRNKSLNVEKTCSFAEFVNLL